MTASVRILGIDPGSQVTVAHFASLWSQLTAQLAPS
jgi:hypothetical protein